MRCTYFQKKNCKARAVQLCESQEVKVFGQHTHLPILNNDNVVSFMAELRKSVNLEQSLKDVYNEVAARYDRSFVKRVLLVVACCRFPESSVLKPFESIRVTMYRWKIKLSS